MNGDDKEGIRFQFLERLNVEIGCDWAYDAQHIDRSEVKDAGRIVSLMSS